MTIFKPRTSLHYGPRRWSAQVWSFPDEHTPRRLGKLVYLGDTKYRSKGQALAEAQEWVKGQDSRFDALARRVEFEAAHSGSFRRVLNQLMAERKKH